jgi:hypothetical protein
VPATNPWAKDVPRAEVPHESILYMGPNPCHSPADENQRRETCKACGGAIITESGDVIPKRGSADPVHALTSVVVVCLCNRSNYAHLRGSQHTPDAKRMSHRAGRVRGRPRKAG